MSVYRWSFGFLMCVAGSASVSVAGRLDADPPARVARLNYMNGSVSLRPAGSDEWAAAVPNRPVTTGDRLWTDADSRAELHVGSTAIRVSAQTELDVTLLDDNTLQVRLAQGSVTIRVRHSDEGQVYEVDTPDGAVSLGQVGDYRVDVGADGATTLVTVSAGGAQVTSAGSSFAVNPRQQATIRTAEGGSGAPTYDLAQAPASDQWDQWCADRDRREDNAQSARYVSTEMTGYEDLDAYGHWRYMGGYGNVWVPASVRAGWAPYHDGRWLWVDPWGWTWVDDAPWGYAPYHYGRWVAVDGTWGWVPGRIVARPVYAPALVVFVGAPAPRPGFGASVVVGGGAVAWFALGPEEVYRPAYAVSPGYVRQVNVTNVTNVTNITNVTNVTNVNTVTYRNREVPGAMMATSNTAFAGARPVQSAAIPVTREFRSAAITGTAPAIVPTRASLASNGGGGRTPPAAIASRPVFARMTPPPAPIPFAAKERALASNGGRPLAPAQLTQIRATSPSIASSAPATRLATAPPAVRVAPPPGVRVGSPPTRGVPMAPSAPRQPAVVNVPSGAPGAGTTGHPPIVSQQHYIAPNASTGHRVNTSTSAPGNQPGPKNPPVRARVDPNGVKAGPKAGSGQNGSAAAPGNGQKHPPQEPDKDRAR